MIQFSNIYKTYGSKKIFKDFNLTINTGDKILLTAPSGSGKTTMMRLILGFEKPDEGNILVNDLMLNRHNLKKIREQIAYVSQDTDLPLMNVEDLLNQIFDYKVNRPISNYIEKFMDLAQTYHLSDQILTSVIGSLSGGERQRLGLIIALTLDRPFLLLDEITSGLDHDLKDQIIQHLLSLDKTIIIISHDDQWRAAEGIKEVCL